MTARCSYCKKFEVSFRGISGMANAMREVYDHEEECPDNPKNKIDPADAEMVRELVEQ